MRASNSLLPVNSLNRAISSGRGSYSPAVNENGVGDAAAAAGAAGAYAAALARRGDLGDGPSRGGGVLGLNVATMSRVSSILAFMRDRFILSRC